MASLTDSEAHFEARAKEYAVPSDIFQAMTASGIKTMGHLAFAITRPGQELDDAKFDNWVAQLNGGVAPALGTTAALRRLHFEAEVILTAA